MPYLLPDDLNTHIYPEIREVITRGDNSMVQEAIDIAVDEAKAYLSRFNLVALFGVYAEGQDDVPPTVNDKNLKAKVKALACWNLIMLANPNIDLKLFRTNYEDAILFFENVKKSKEAPEAWLYKTDDPDTPFPEGNIISYSTNIKRNNHY